MTRVLASSTARPRVSPAEWPAAGFRHRALTRQLRLGEASTALLSFGGLVAAIAVCRRAGGAPPTSADCYGMVTVREPAQLPGAPISSVVRRPAMSDMAHKPLIANGFMKIQNSSWSVPRVFNRIHLDVEVLSP